MVAKLLSVFHLTIEDIGRLTPWQIRELYFHARDDKGEIVPVGREPRPGTLDYEVREARVTAKQLGLDPDELEQEVRRTWTKPSRRG
jgi:hypothetical protein